jgi:hypothetical protein
VSAGCARGRRSSGQDGAARGEVERLEHASPVMARTVAEAELRALRVGRSKVKGGEGEGRGTAGGL